MKSFSVVKKLFPLTGVNPGKSEKAMSDQDSGNKTESATPKRLRDARKKGDVAKSRDLSNTLLLGYMVLFLWFGGQQIATGLLSFTDNVLITAASSGEVEVLKSGARAVDLLISVSVKCFLSLIVVALLIEFVQTGPIFALDKVKPKHLNINLVSGIKRIFSLNSLVELIKSVVKTLAIVSISLIVAYNTLEVATNLSGLGTEHLAQTMKFQTGKLFGATFLLFTLIALADLAYQKHAFAKKMKMSLEEIKREHKNDEGDPQIKAQRQQLSREWAMEGATSCAGNATVLLVNPTHIAIALEYDKETTPAPTVTATGVDDVALAMREAARAANVPVLKNIDLARSLLKQTKSGDVVPRELFGIIAEVVVWAESVSAQLNGTNSHSDNTKAETTPAVPREDLTAYPGYCFK